MNKSTNTSQDPWEWYICQYLPDKISQMQKHIAYIDFMGQQKTGFVASGVSFLVFFFRLLKFCGLKACGEIETTSYSIRYIW